MADSKESFETLEDGSGNGVAATASQAGDASGGKIGMTAFAFKDSGGNLQLPEMTASGALKTDGSATTQPISAASLPLPSGAATSANQTTANSSLSSIDSKLTSPLTVSVNNFPATQNVAVTSSVEVEVKNDTGSPVPVSGTVSATQSGSWSVGVNNAAGASAVNIQDGGNSITVDGTVTANQGGTWNINNVSGTVSLPTGAATSANQATEIASLASIDTKLTSPLSIVGNVASAATDSGNPVKTGAVYTTTIPLFTTGQRGNSLCDENGGHIFSRQDAAYTAMQKVYSATNTSALTVGTSEVAIFLFKNPNGSGLKARIFKMQFTGSATYRVYHTPTTSANGTALTAVNQRIMTSPAAAVMTPFQSPTASANGTFMFPVSASTQSGTAILTLDHQPILNPNFNLLITAQAGSNNTSVNVTIFWEEVA